MSDALNCMHILSGYHLITARCSTVTRELPGHYPNVVLNTYVTSIVSGWQAPSETLLNEDRSAHGRDDGAHQHEYSDYRRTRSLVKKRTSDNCRSTGSSTTI